MARSSQGYDTAGSQFFICIEDATSLDGNYAAFGKVIDGFHVVEEIVENEKVADETNGLLQHNLVLKKALVDLKGQEYAEPDILSE